MRLLGTLLGNTSVLTEFLLISSNTPDDHFAHTEFYYKI